MRLAPALAVAALLSGSLAAHADSIFNASGTFADGSSLSGQVFINTTSGTVDSVNLSTLGPDDYGITLIASQSATRFPSEYFIGARSTGSTEDFNFNIPAAGSSSNALVGYSGGPICSATVSCAAGSNLYNLKTNSAGSGLVSGSLTPAPTKTFQQQVSVAPNTPAINIPNAQGVMTSKFDSFSSPLLSQGLAAGTLDSVSISLEGTATHTKPGYDAFYGLAYLSGGTLFLIYGQRSGSISGNGTFALSDSVNASDPRTLQIFDNPYGDSDLSLALWFAPVGGTVVNNANLTITYNYTPFNTTTVGSSDPSAVTPEPSSFILLGTGLLGTLGAARRRFKQ